MGAAELHGNDKLQNLSIQPSPEESISSVESSSSSDLMEDAAIQPSPEESISSFESSSSSDLMEDAASPPSYGPLYELSELMAQLPIKRGLSRYYQGKSQSFASMASVRSVEDLAKKGRESRRKMKPCQSYGGLDNNHVYSPKAAMFKKTSRSSPLPSFGGRRGTLLSSCNHPISVQKNP